MDLIQLLDYAGVAVFAATGALAASRKELDLIGFIFLAGVTGTGGGTLRDLVLGVPVFWVENHTYIIVCALVAVLVFFAAPLVEYRYRLLLWLDAACVSPDVSIERSLNMLPLYLVWGNTICISYIANAVVSEREKQLEQSPGVRAARAAARLRLRTAAAGDTAEI